MIRTHFPKLSLAMLVVAGSAQAQPTPDFTWNKFAGTPTTWSTAVNWLPAAAPTPSINRVLGFPSSPLQSAGGYTTTYDLGAFDLNSLVFTSGGASNPSLLVSGNAGADTLQFDTSSTNVLPSIWQMGTGRVVIQNGASSAGITLNNGTTLQILGSGIGEIQLGASPSANSLTIADGGTGGGSLLINQTGTRPLFTGSQVHIGGSNSFSGGVTLTAGNLVIANGAALGSGTFTVNGGSVQFDPTSTATFTLQNPITLSGNMVVTGTSTAATVPNPIASFGGSIAGPGGITFNNTNATVAYAFNASNTFTGPVTILPFGNTATTVTFGSTTNSLGTASGATAFTASYSSTLRFDNTNGVFTRLNTTTAPTLNLNTATVQLFGNAGINSAEAFGNLTVSGQGLISVLGASGATATSTLSFSGLTRQANGTLFIAATNLGSGTGSGESIVQFATNPGGAVGAGGAVGTPSVNILPYAVANAAATFAPGTTAAAASTGLVRWDAASHQIVPLNPATEYANNLFIQGATGPATNQQFASTSAIPAAFGVAGLVTPTTVNALVLDTNTLAISNTNRTGVSLDGPATLTVSGGTIFSTINGGTGNPSNPSLINLGGLTAGANPLYIHAFAGLTINSPITGSGGLVKAAGGTLALTATNSFTGGITVNAGLVQFSSDANLGQAGQPLVLDGGIVGGIQFQPNHLFTPATTTTATVNRPITLGPSGATVSVAFADNQLTLPGTISGPGQLFKNGVGVLNLTGTNTYTGVTTAAAGILTANTDAALGDPASNVILAGGTFQPAASFATSRSFLMTASSFIFTNGQNLTLNGNLTTQTAPGANTFFKVGNGDLILTAQNTFSSQFQLGESGPTIRATAPTAAQGSGRLVLTGANGGIPEASAVFAIGGGTIVLDNTAAANNNRIGSVTVSLIGGNMTLQGNAGTSVNEAIGSLSISNGNNQYGGTLTLVTPAGSGQSTTLTATSFTPQPAPQVGTLFVRGTNLGAAAGDRTAVVFAANPTQVNGLIPAMVGATSATGEPTDFLTTAPVSVPAPNANQFSLVTFTGYTPSSTLNATAGSSTATYDVTTPVGGLPAASAANALRINAGGSVDLSGSTMTLSSGAILATGGQNSGITGGTLAYATGITARFTVATGSDLTVTSAITGTTGGLVKAGGGTLLLFGPVTTTTGLIGVSQGTLSYGVANVLPTTSAVFVNAGALLDLSSTNSTLAGVIGLGDTNIGGSLTINAAAAPIQAYGGGFRGAGTLIKTGAGAFTVVGNSPNFSGDIQILNGGSAAGSGAAGLIVNSTGALGTGTTPILLGDTSGSFQAQLSLGTAVSSFSRDITVQAGSTPANQHTLMAGPNTSTISSNITLGQSLRLTGTSGSFGTVSLTGHITGPGGLNVFSGNWAVSGNNDYAGGTTVDTIQSTALGVGSDTAFGSGPITFTSFGSAFRADNGARTLANNIVLQTGAYFGVGGRNDLTLNGSVDLSGAAAAQTFNVMSLGTTTINGVIQNSIGGINKNGPGVLVITAGNTYSGTTTVNAGTLIVNNSTGSGTGSGSGAVIVNAGAILGGNGTIGDGSPVPVMVNPGGVIRPGPSLSAIGNLLVSSASNVAFSPGSTLQVNVGASPTVGGKLTISDGGTVDLSGLSAATPMNLYLTNIGGLTSTPYSLIVMDAGPTPILFPGSGFNANLFNLTANFGFAAPPSITNPSAGRIVLNFTPVPEPAAVLAACAAAGFAGWVRRRRQNG
jgi:autotransporter-associated beta strand protein